MCKLVQHISCNTWKNTTWCSDILFFGNEKYCDKPGIAEPVEMFIATQLLSKHMSAAKDTHKVMEELLEILFFVWSVLKPYDEDRWDKDRQEWALAVVGYLWS